MTKDDARQVDWDYCHRNQMEAHISALEAARDHLRARLRALIMDWHTDATREHDRGNALDHVRDSQSYCYGTEHALDKCAADLLAVLTEQVEDDKNKKENNLARIVTMGEGTDSRTASEVPAGSVEPITPTQVNLEVASEMRFLVAGPDTDEDVVTLKQSLRRRLLAWAERLSTKETS